MRRESATGSPCGPAPACAENPGPGRQREIVARYQRPPATGSSLLRPHSGDKSGAAISRWAQRGTKSTAFAAPLANRWRSTGRAAAVVEARQTAWMQVSYGVLGPLEATVDGRPVRLGGQRPRAVLAVLLLRSGQVVPTPVLIDAVWGNDPPSSAANLVQGYVSGLRKELGRGSIETTDPGYRLTVPPDAFDLRRFERLAADGRAALNRGRTDDALGALNSALALWRGPALSDVLTDGLMRACAARLEELRLAVQERRAEAMLAAGAARDAVNELAPIVDEHPLREGPRALLMLALYRCGRQADALEVFRRGRDILVGELGIEPGAALRDAESAILRHDGTLDGQPTAAIEVRPPDDRRNSRTVMLAALHSRSIPALVALGTLLVDCREEGELIVATTVRDAAKLTGVVGALNELRLELIGRGVRTRTAGFTSLTPGADLARLAGEQDADLLVVDAPDGLLEDARLTSLLETAPCDVAVLIPGEQRDGAVLVAFAGADHDWAAVELGAWFSRCSGAPLLLAGALVGAGGRDASRLLANASLAVQRALGVAAEPLLVEPEPAALVAAAADARLVIVGLTERWRHEGVGRARTALATAGGHPTLLVRRGLRPGGLAAGDAGTRFTWTVAGHG